LTDDAVGDAPTANIDRRALALWMDAQGMPGEGELPELSTMGGGASNLIVELVRGGRHFVMRRPPPDIAADRQSTIVREQRILEALGRTEVPHARLFGTCTDESIAGSWFFVTEFVDGFSVMQTRSWPPPFDDDLEVRSGLAYELIRGIAELSKVDWSAVGLTDLGRPDGFHERQADRWAGHMEKVKFREVPGFDEAGAWLRGRSPRNYTPGIMHGDYQFANVMFRHDAPASLAAIIDWEMGTIGDPLLDLAWVLMSWPNADEDRTQRGSTDYGGMPDREDLMAYYEQASGRSTEEFDYYLVLSRYKMAAVLEQGYSRWVAGTSRNPIHEYFGDIVLEQAARAAELAASLS